MKHLALIAKIIVGANSTGSGKAKMNIRTTIKKLAEIKKYAPATEKTALYSAIGYIKKYQMILENPELIIPSAKWIVYEDGSCCCTRCSRRISGAESNVSYCSGCGAKIIGKVNHIQNRR